VIIGRQGRGRCQIPICSYAGSEMAREFILSREREESLVKYVRKNSGLAA